MNVLVIAAHPDDEVLGAGATIHRLSREGHSVYVCIASHRSPTREDGLDRKIARSHSIIGVTKAFVGSFECMKFKDAPHHSLVMFIEDALKEARPDVVVIHHPADVHIDHKVLAECSLEAVRLPQRQTEDIRPIERVLFMEVPSSTDWSADTSSARFAPNAYAEVDESDIEAKVEAIKVYENVVRHIPHPRSEEAIGALATVRGAEFGVPMAEAFQQAFGVAL